MRHGSSIILIYYYLYYSSTQRPLPGSFVQGIVQNAQQHTDLKNLNSAWKVPDPFPVGISSPHALIIFIMLRAFPKL